MHLFDHVNQLPAKVENADFSRAQHWLLEGWGKFKRQTVFLSAFLFPELRALSNHRCSNLSGQVFFF